MRISKGNWRVPATKPHKEVKSPTMLAPGCLDISHHSDMSHPKSAASGALFNIMTRILFAPSHSSNNLSGLLALGVYRAPLRHARARSKRFATCYGVSRFTATATTVFCRLALHSVDSADEIFVSSLSFPLCYERCRKCGKESARSETRADPCVAPRFGYRLSFGCKSKRSRFMTLLHTLTKSFTNFCCASWLA